VRPCAPPAAAVVEAVSVVPSAAHAGLYALLQCGEDSEYARKADDGYFEVFHALLAEDSESSPPTSGNFQSAAA
jgi:glucosinolate gamma-glutamyl hydrolase